MPQDAPRDASAAYLAGLQSTAALLTALQQGYIARQNILANAQPCQLETLWLPDQSRNDPNPGLEWHILNCQQVQFSHNGIYMAIELAGMQFAPEEEGMCQEAPDEDYQTWIQELVLYRTSGFQQLACISFGTADPIIHWTCSGELCVAQRPERSCTHMSALTLSDAASAAPEPTAIEALAFAWDAGSRAVTRRLPSDVCPEFQSLPKDGWRNMAWSASGRYLLMHEQHASGSNAEQVMGWLSICNVTAGNLPVQCRVPVFTSVRCSASWHPGLHGLIFTHTKRQTHVSSLQEAGFAAGALPDGLLMHQAGFSSDARYLIAETPRTSTPWESMYHVLRCSISGLRITFDFVQRLDCISDPGWQACKLHWLPSTYSLFIQYREGMHASCEHMVHQVNPANAVRSEVSVSSFAFLSPSSSWFLQQLPFGVSIHETGTGMEVWQSMSSDPQWPARRTSSRECKMFGLQIGCDIHRQDTFELCGWLPSGLGFLCSTSQCTYTRDCRPPALHVYRFA